MISQFKDAPIHNRFRDGQTFLRAQVAANLAIKKEEQVMTRKERPHSPSVLEGNHLLSMEIGSSPSSIKEGGITTREVRHSLLKKTDSFTLQIPCSDLGIGEAASAPPPFSYLSCRYMLAG